MRCTPGNIAAVTNVFKGWFSAFNQNLTGGRFVAFWGLVLVVIALYWPLTRIGRRFIGRESKVEDPTPWQKTLVALWNGLSVAVPLIAIMYGVIYVFSFFTVPDAGVTPLFDAIQWGVIRIAVAGGLSRGILAPNRPKWRLVDVNDAAWFSRPGTNVTPLTVVG